MQHDPEIQKLLDERAIRTCLQTYSRGCDRHDYDCITAAYHEDAVDERGGVQLSPTQLWDRLETVHHANWTSHMHNLFNCRIEIEGSVAQVETYFMATHVRKDGQGVDLVGGRYIDRMEKRNGQWKIARRRQIAEWHGILPPHDADHPMSKFSDVGVVGAWDRSDISYEPA